MPQGWGHLVGFVLRTNRTRPCSLRAGRQGLSLIGGIAAALIVATALCCAPHLVGRGRCRCAATADARHPRAGAPRLRRRGHARQDRRHHHRLDEPGRLGGRCPAPRARCRSGPRSIWWARANTPTPSMPRRALPTDLERRTVEWAAIYYGNGADPLRRGAGLHGRGARLRRQGRVPHPHRAGADQGRRTRRRRSSRRSAAGCPTRSTRRSRSPRPMSRRARRTAPRRSRASIWVGRRSSMPASEAKVLAALGDLLTPKDHWARAEHLMMTDRASAVERLIKFMTPGAEIAGGRPQRRVAQRRQRQGAARQGRSGVQDEPDLLFLARRAGDARRPSGTTRSPTSTRARRTIPTPRTGGTSGAR